jgi:hypothetical protein
VEIELNEVIVAVTGTTTLGAQALGTNRVFWTAATRERTVPAMRRSVQALPSV